MKSPALKKSLCTITAGDVMNIFRYEFKTYIKSILVWVLSISALTALFMGFYPSFAQDTETLEKIMDYYPEELLQAFGMSTGLPLSTVLGFFVFTYAFVQLCLAIQASNYGFSMLSVEERELTADFLMSKPVSRRKIFIAKICAALLALLITNAATWVASYFSLEAFNNGNPYAWDKVVVLLSTNAAFQLFFLSIGMLVSVLTKKIRSVLSYSMGLSFGMYMLNALSSIIDSDLLGLVSPFYHFDPGAILESGEIDGLLLWISIGVIGISFIATYILYNRRNIHSL